MPFANCQRCGRLFHTFEPTLPEAPEGYWPNLRLGDAVLELCPEYLATPRDQPHALGPNPDADRIDGRAT